MPSTAIYILKRERSYPFASPSQELKESREDPTNCVLVMTPHGPAVLPCVISPRFWEFPQLQIVDLVLNHSIRSVLQAKQKRELGSLSTFLILYVIHPLTSPPKILSPSTFVLISSSVYFLNSISLKKYSLTNLLLTPVSNFIPSVLYF